MDFREERHARRGINDAQNQDPQAQAKEVAALIGPQAEIYRCEFCKTLYRPDPAQQPQSYTLRN